MRGGPGHRARHLPGQCPGWGLGLEGDIHAKFVAFITQLVKISTELDTELIEINPLVITSAGDVVALDGKMSFADNAL